MQRFLDSAMRFASDSLFVMAALTAIAAGSFLPPDLRASTLDISGEADIFLFDMGPGFVSGMSSNGDWGVFRMADFEEEDAIPKRMNLSTGEIEILPLDASQTGNHICQAYDITDDGERIFGAYDRLPAVYDVACGRWEDLPLDFNTRGYSGAAHDVTPDGRWACGWLMSSISSFRPALWHDGECVKLGDLPDYEEMYRLGIIDDEDYDMHAAAGQTPNIAFWKVSSDGKYVLASTDHNYPGWGCAYFIYHTETSTYEWIRDPGMPDKCFTSGATMSDNGEWISAVWTGTKVFPDGSWDDVHTRFRVHTPDGKVDYTSVRGLIGNDGSGFNLSVRVGDSDVRLEKVLRQVYGLDIAEKTGYDSFGTLFNVSADRRTILCQPGYRSAAISAKIPVPFDEAAHMVNLLADPRITPAEGTVISCPERITIEFDAPARHNKDFNAYIKKTGKPEAYAEKVVAESGGRRFILHFPGLALEAGEEYELIMPEGMFESVAGSDVMPEQSVIYIGRPDLPIAPCGVTPAEGAALSELSTFSMVILDFGMQPVATDRAAAYLYAGDSDKPITYLNMAIDGNRVALYPPARRNLAKGKTYRVVIGEGSFTDIMGRCANEEICVEYNGAYVLSQSQQVGNVLFFDDFTDPNQSLNNFLQYEGDHLTPSAEMEAWGFDADNTPWNFSVRDDDEYDYCAAATSSYLQSGPADDWMLLPRLSITNEYDFLTFKGQSYRLSADDRLRIYVWESGEDYGELDEDLICRLKSEAVLVFDERLSPGRLEGRLRDDWQRFEIPLKDFAGKDVYIAFANTNETGSAIFIDDICVEYRGNFTLSTDLPAAIIGSEPVEIGFYVEVNNDVQYSDLKASYKVPRSGEMSAFEISDPGLKKGDRRYFVFPRRCSLLRGEINDVVITVSLDGETQSLAVRIANPIFEARRGVLIEEATGEWCGFCPSGFVALEYLGLTYPGLINEISIHHDDSYSFESYIGFLGFQGYPSGRVDREPKMLSPLVADPSTGLLSLTSEGGDETFVDMVERVLATPAEVGIEVRAFRIEDDVIKASLAITPTLNQYDVDWNILTVVTEYDLPGLQQNNYSGMSDPLMADWSALGGKTLYEFPAVARATGEGGFLGCNGLLPNNPVAGKEYGVEIEVSLPNDVVDIAKCRLVAAILSAADGRVLNSVSAGYGREISGVSLSGGAVKGFTVLDGKVLYEGSEDRVRVFDFQGRPLANEGLSGPVIAVHPAGGSVKIR